KLSGLEVLRALRGEDATRAVPVLILSNSSRESDTAEVTRLGTSGYFVTSTLSLQELGELVGRLLANPTWPRSASRSTSRGWGPAVRGERYKRAELARAGPAQPRLPGFTARPPLRHSGHSSGVHVSAFTVASDTRFTGNRAVPPLRSISQPTPTTAPPAASTQLTPSRIQPPVVITS